MSIKFYQAAQYNAPVLSGSVGSLIALLDAVLVSGYGDATVTSMERSGGTVSVITESQHGLATGDTVRLSGAEQEGYNGDHLVSVISSTAFSFSVASEPVSPATGVIVTKRAPAGFEKVFSGTNKAVYRSLDASSLRHYLQVVDDGATSGSSREARIRGFVSMDDLDTGAEPFPTESQSALGLLAYKSNAISAAARPWKLITDGKTFYFGACMDQAPSSMMESGGYIWWTAFGDLKPTMPNDQYSSFIAGNNLQNSQTNNNSQNGLFLAATRSFSGGSASLFMPRDWANSIGSVSCQGIGHGWDQANVAGSLAMFPYPHPQDNGFYMTQWNMTQRGVLRGGFPGVFEPLQGRCLNNYGLIDGVNGYPGRKFMALWGRYTSNTGMLMFDITGPWS